LVYRSLFIAHRGRDLYVLGFDSAPCVFFGSTQTFFIMTPALSSILEKRNTVNASRELKPP
jgi:hypothetical protein